MYTRAVYNEYKREYANNTTFVIEPDPDVEWDYLDQFTSRITGLISSVILFPS
jgi:hypothetical protein